MLGNLKLIDKFIDRRKTSNRKILKNSKNGDKRKQTRSDFAISAITKRPNKTERK